MEKQVYASGQAMNQQNEKRYVPRREQAALRPGDSMQPIVLDSRELFCNRKEIQIRHEDELYRLRVTRNGKLILNK